jgi:hypothetical protein
MEHRKPKNVSRRDAPKIAVNVKRKGRKKTERGDNMKTKFHSAGGILYC